MSKTREEQLEKTVLFILFGMIEINAELCEKSSKGEINKDVPIPIMCVMQSLLKCDIMKEFFSSAKSKKADELHNTMKEIVNAMTLYLGKEYHGKA